MDELRSAIGLVEITHMADAVLMLDTMLKTANVKFLTWEKKQGGRLVTIIIAGSVSDVSEAVCAVKDNKQVVDSAVIASPHKETLRLIQISREKNRFI